MHHNHISWVTATCNASIWIDSTKWMRQGTGIRQELLITIRALTQRNTVDYYFVTYRVICKFIRIRKSRTAFIFKGNNSFQTLATNESVLCDEADCFMSDTTGDNMTHVLKSFTFCFIVSYVMQLNVLGRMELYTNRPLNVFSCPGGLLKNISDIDQQLCTRHCLFHPACRVLSYNQRDRFCMLGEIPCNVAENHTGYMLMVFKPSVSEDCIIWKSDPLPSRTVDSHLGDHEALCRKNIEPSILIGHGKHSERAKFVENGKLIKGHGSSVLTVSPSCTLAWMPYIARSTLPENALVCGYLTNVGPTYCARMWLDETRVRFGYYPLGHAVGCYRYYRVSRKSTEMDIFVQV